MRVLRGTLVSDGSSDRMLFPVLRWLGREHGVVALELERPNFGSLPERPEGLVDRIRAAVGMSPCDLLFLHRDAEARTFQEREDEISRAMSELGSTIPHVRIIPVRMSEAWLLIEEKAIRRVAQKPNGRTQLDIPHVRQLESLPDPKSTLIKMLLDASELRGRRRDQFKRRTHEHIHQVAEFISDFSPLRQVDAFARLEAEFVITTAGLGQ